VTPPALRKVLEACIVALGSSQHELGKIIIDARLEQAEAEQ